MMRRMTWENQNATNMCSANAIVLPRIAGTAKFHANITILHMLQNKG